MTTLTLYNLTSSQIADVKRQVSDPAFRNLSIYSMTPGQIQQVQLQMTPGQGGAAPPGSGMPPPDSTVDVGGSAPIVPGGGPEDEAALAALKAAPSDWAAYTFATNKEWGALNNLYGSAAVNNVINFYNAYYHMNGYCEPKDAGTGLRSDTNPGPYQYHFKLDQQNAYEEDTGQADAYLKDHYSHQAPPKLPCRP